MTTRGTAHLSAGAPSPAAPTGPLPPGPVPTPPTSGSAPLLPLPAWAGLVCAVALVVAQQSAIGLHALPPSTPIAVALVVLGIVSATAAALQTLFAQYSAHAQTMARLTRDGSR